MIRKILLLVVLFQVSLIVLAQTEADALRYAELIPTGTARYTAMGGAFGALGGDMSTMATNPAGIGVYRKSDFGITMGWNGSQIKSNYFGSKNTSSEMDFAISNMGFVITNSETGNDAWKYVNIGFSYNKLADYNYRFLISGDNVQSTILDEVAYNFNEGINNLRDDAIDDVNVLFLDANDNFVHDYQSPVNRRGSNTINEVISSGHVGEYDFTIGANYLDNLYLGATLGIQVIRYEQGSRITETPEYDALSLNSLMVYDWFKTKGNGFNLKLGAIYKVNQMARIGFSFHTPTIYNMRDDYFTEVESDMEGIGDFSGQHASSTGELYYNYNYVSPLRATGSLALVIGKMGLVSGEVEYVDYTSMNISADDDSFTETNNLIDTLYRGAFNYKLGAEFRLGMMALRAGGAYYSSSFVSSQPNSDASTFVYSGGIGFNTGNMYLDFSYQQALNSQKYYMYSGAEETTLEINNRKYLFTVGFRF